MVDDEIESIPAIQQPLKKILKVAVLGLGSAALFEGAQSVWGDEGEIAFAAFM